MSQTYAEYAADAEWLPDDPCAVLHDCGLTDRVAPFFDRIEPRRQALRYAEALLLRQAERKNGWQIAREIGDAHPWRTQRLLNRANWDVDGVRDVVRDYVVECVGDPASVVALGELAVTKKGSASVGVSRQYNALTRRVENCQVAVFAAYVAPGGDALIDRELFLPGSWTENPERCRRSGIPLEDLSATKVDLGRRELQRTLAAGVPFSWVSGDVAYGSDRAFRSWLVSRRIGYVLAVPGSETVRTPFAGAVRADALARRLPRNIAELRTGGGREVAWAGVPVAGHDLTAADGFEYTLLIGRTVERRSRVTYHLAHAPEGTPLPELVRVACTRAALDRSLLDARERAGLDQYEVRTWKAWYRHVTLAMLAVAPGRVRIPARR